MQEAGRGPCRRASGRLGRVQARLQRGNLGVLQPQQLLQLPRLGLQDLRAGRRPRVGVVLAGADPRMASRI